MTLRPIPARWFEILIARDDLVAAVEALARTGDVELETHSETTQRAMMPDLRDRFEEYNRLARRYQPYWPHENLRPSDVPGQPAKRMDTALEKLNQWQAQADALVITLEKLQTEQNELRLILDLLQNLENPTLDLGRISHAGPALSARLFVLPVTAHVEHLPPAALSIRVNTERYIFLLAVGPSSNLEALQRDLILEKGRAVMLPPWLSGNRDTAIEQIKQHQLQNQATITQLHEQINALSQQHELEHVIGDIQQLEWFITHVRDLPVLENFAWITGWTRDIEGKRLNQVLEKNSVRAVVHFPLQPVGVKPPMVLVNPWWSRPFELFASMLGTPAQNEMDPTLLLVIMVPLIFGYMFGDVGQGAVIIIVGAWLSRRWPMLKLLIGCGIASVIFGFLFGSVFGMEDVLQPLWISPIQEPLKVLAMPLAGGVIILLLGLVLNGLQYFWRGEWRLWLRVEAAVIMIYSGLIASIYDASLALLIVIGLLWYFIGSATLNTAQMGKTLALALGQLLESVFQLIINTISFVRVGAFALAHAGLSLAVMIMTHSIANPVLSVIILVLGNVIILLLEGMVVSIQTTRLILFEFFIRFLKGSGRIFQPLVAPVQGK